MRNTQISSLSLRSTWIKSFSKRTLSSFATRFASFSNPRITVRPKTKRLRTSRSRVANSKLKMRTTKLAISSSRSRRSKWCSLTSKNQAVAPKPKNSRRRNPNLPDQSHSPLPKHCNHLRLRSKLNRKRRFWTVLIKLSTEYSSNFLQVLKTWTLKFCKRFLCSNKTSTPTDPLPK